MTATELFKAGKLQEAVAAQTQEVKAKPADQARRLFLFELLAFAGDLDRAEKQIDAINYGEMERDAAVQSYRNLLEAERARRNLFAQGIAPHFFGEQPEHARLRLEAVARLREKHPAEAAELLEKVNASLATRGTLNGKPFAVLRDCDDLFAGILEVMAHGQYYWVPLEQVAGVAVNPPKFPRDLLWLPARLEMADAAGDVFLPALYPGSHEHADESVKLGRMTDWRGGDGGPVLGAGLRTFLADDDAVPLPEWRQLVVGEAG